jgi:hypothetical protein
MGPLRQELVVAYCEIGQKECELLDIVQMVDEELLAERIDGRQKDSEFSDSIVEAVERFKPKEEDSDLLSCSVDNCGIIKKLIIKGIMLEAANIQEVKEAES